MEPGTLTRVLHDFLTTVEGELSLRKGDYFLVHQTVDKHWCYGQSTDKYGKFPLSHLHKVDLPQPSNDECLFVSIAPFPGEQDGDLAFAQGEVIVGTQDAGGGWYVGEIGSRTGIFPTTHAWQLDNTLIQTSFGKKSIRKKARVKATLKAQLDEELDLTEGDIVIVTEILEDGWCHGETEDGRKGTFPEGFISYIDEDSGDQADAGSRLSSTPIPCMPQPSERHENVEKNIPTTSYSDEPAPNYYDLFPQLSEELAKGPEQAQCDDNSNTLNVKPYAITLYPFNSQFPNELSFGAGEVVHLIKHVDSEWIEGTIDGTKGIFPASYVNIIVDCTETKDDQVSTDLDAKNAEYDQLEPGSAAKVEYTFQAQMDGDLSVMEGESVTVVEMANNDWVNVKNSTGQIGLCPRGYLSPSSETVAESANDPDSLLDDFVVIRTQQSQSVPREEQRSKRLSEPHRPAPPAPGPGRVPLQNKTVNDESPAQSLVESNENLGNNAADARQKRADQRQNVISELVITEKEYVRDLKLTYETFNLYNPSFLESKGIDVTTLFGNLLDVIHVAEELLDMILKAMKNRSENAQTVGPCFLKMAEKMQTVYVKYCGNHEAALVLLKKYENNEEIMVVFNKGTETLRHQIACFDMSSILIKPVQRILKYPLMLYELIKCTEDDHPDKPVIQEAWKAMTDVASYINEYKRRKDIVSKYLEDDNTLMRKMAKISMHSVAKMSTRLSTKLSATLGLTNVAPDPEFDELERQFKSVEKCTYQLAKDVEQSMLYLSDEAIFGELMTDSLIQYYQGAAGNEVKKFRDIRSLIWSQFMHELKACIERRVSAPVNFLATLLEGPSRLITKRHNKLLDYDAAISKSEKSKESKIAQDELSVAKENYEALNQQLIEELPVLIDASTKLLVSCINAFANARKLLSGKITKHYLSLCENATHLSTQDILESFLVNHSLLWNQITRFEFAGTNPRIAENEQQSKCCPQGERQRNLLTSKYPPNKLYIVLENVVSTTSLDLGAAKGTIVAAIKMQDPMGDPSRWYVDNGVSQGFVPAQKLQKLSVPEQVSPPNRQQPAAPSTNTASDRSSPPDLMSLDSPEKEIKPTSHTNLQALLYLNVDEGKENHYSNTDQILKPQQHINSQYEFYYAMYDFAGNMPGTMSISRGQALKLVRSHDEKGNNEWWLMEDRYGKTGYVPQNYLSPPPRAN